MGEAREWPAAGGAAPGPDNGPSATEGLSATEPAARDPWATFDRWTSNLFLLLVVLGFVVLLTFGGLAGATTDVPLVVVLLTLVIVGVGAALLVVVSVALDRRRPWARTAASNLLVILVVTGLGGALLDLTRSTITVPLAALAGIYVLARKPGPLPVLARRDRRVAAGISALFLAATLSPGLPSWLFTADASPLVADRDAFVLTITTSCPDGPVVAPDDDPLVVATVTWRWRSRDAVPVGSDAIELAWPDVGGLRPLWDRGQPPPGSTEGGNGAALRRLEQIYGPGDQAIRYSFDAAGASAVEGTLLAPFPADMSDGGITFDLVATYAHGAAWTKVTSTSCELVPRTSRLGS